MAKRRGNGEGAIAKRANGTYEGKITITDPLTGARKRVSVYGPTAPVVRAKMKVLRARVDAGAPVRDATATVADWLARWRATTLAVSGRKEATRSLYATLSRKHLEAPPFGAIPLDKLRPADIEALLLGLRERGLSQSTVRQVFIVARLGLDGAVRDGLIATNPASRVQAPGVTPREAVHLSAADVAALLAACESSRYHRALVLIAATGLRRGEAFALPWSAVDLDAGLLRVVATVGRIDGRLVTSAPKTAKSRRTVPLDETVVAMLRRHRVEQKAERLAAHTWTERGLVFTDENGALVDPRTVLRVLQDAAQRLSIAGVGLHTLRHSAAVAWLEQGVHIKAVSDLLGHSSIAITGDVYGHTSDEAARAAITGLAGRLGLS
jgi:integrase